MNKPALFLAILLCLMHGQSMAQQPGSVKGKVFTDPSPSADTLNSIEVQSDGKIVVAGNSNQGSYMVIAVGRYEGETLDSSFGNNGIATTFLDSAHTTARAVKLQPDGKIVVAGSYQKGTVSDFILVRYKPDGSPDSSFGINGIVRTDIGTASFDVAVALAIQTDGRMVVAGRSGSSLALCRYNPDGSLDNSFDSDGKLTVAAVEGATGMKLQTDGKMVVCCGNVVVRLLPDGSLDNSFGSSGVATLLHYSYGMAIQNDGKILLAGGDDKFVLQRLNPAGIKDNGFGTGGVVITTGFIPTTTNPGQQARWVCVQSDGRILSGGWAQSGILGNWKDFVVARYQSNGAPDNSFGVNGKAWLYIAGYIFARSYAAAINNNNELVVVGNNDEYGTFSKLTWGLVRCYLGPSLDVTKVVGGDNQISVAP